MINILLADDHKILLDGLKAFLQTNSNINIVGEALNGIQVLDILKEHKVDVAVLDIEMPEMDGVETTKQIKKCFPNTKVLILSMYKEKAIIIKLMEMGASGYILKNRSKEELIEAINRVYAGDAHFGIEVLNTITNAPKETKLLAELTKRED